MRVGNFRTKVDMKIWKSESRNRSLDGAEYSTQVSAPVSKRFGDNEKVPDSRDRVIGARLNENRIIVRTPRRYIF